ncbi:uncharacterized protein [Triticum aestivum]|uniref:uncharacterized protein n=1 Tax=Triticum aestivum TaxID=4565 RepID=UPI001D02BC85|nr:uncharacterized protein LOC123093665 [Triticum aestivum]
MQGGRRRKSPRRGGLLLTDLRSALVSSLLAILRERSLSTSSKSAANDQHSVSRSGSISSLTHAPCLTCDVMKMDGCDSEGTRGNDTTVSAMVLIRRRYKNEEDTKRHIDE